MSKLGSERVRHDPASPDGFSRFPNGPASRDGFSSCPVHRDGLISPVIRAPDIPTPSQQWSDGTVLYYTLVADGALTSGHLGFPSSGTVGHHGGAETSRATCQDG